MKYNYLDDIESKLDKFLSHVDKYNIKQLLSNLKFVPKCTVNTSKVDQSLTIADLMTLAPNGSNNPSIHLEIKLNKEKGNYNITGITFYNNDTYNYIYDISYSCKTNMLSFNYEGFDKEAFEYVREMSHDNFPVRKAFTDLFIECDYYSHCNVKLDSNFNIIEYVTNLSTNIKKEEETPTRSRNSKK